MSFLQPPESYIGMGIDDICQNKFHDPNSNHCAHFVSHVLGITFSFNCRQYAGGNAQPANIRVHEIFAQCPTVGKWEDADQSRDQLVFVTRKDVVSLPTKKMQNIPQKHIGIFTGGHVYHYSNTADKVVKDRPEAFLQKFQNAYSGDQGLFFGHFPMSGVLFAVDATAASVPQAGFKLRKDGSRWYARRMDRQDGEFLVGSEVNQPARNFHGLHIPNGAAYGPRFDASSYTTKIDHWAYLLDVTAAGEGGGYMNVINTYDRAAFTFGFYQLAAHTPNDNLILLFREALRDGEFQSLFPDLKLKAGRVFRIDSQGETDLEAETYDPVRKERQLRAFMTYLNPKRGGVEEQEVLQAARLMWWTNQTEVGRLVQVSVANAILQRKMTERYEGWYGLDGASDAVCAAIADIHHQGRGTKTAVRQALKQSDPLAALTKIGAEDYPERCRTLRKRIAELKTQGIFGRKVYDAALNEFR